MSATVGLVGRQVWVTSCLYDYVGTGVPQIADDLLQRPSRQSRARSSHWRRRRDFSDDSRSFKDYGLERHQLLAAPSLR